VVEDGSGPWQTATTLEKECMHMLMLEGGGVVEGGGGWTVVVEGGAGAASCWC